jgi:hypothetical protein
MGDSASNIGRAGHNQRHQTALRQLVLIMQGVWDTLVEMEPQDHLGYSNDYRPDISGQGLGKARTRLICLFVCLFVYICLCVCLCSTYEARTREYTHKHTQTHTNTNKHTTWPDKVRCGLTPWRRPPHQRRAPRPLPQQAASLS